MFHIPCVGRKKPSRLERKGGYIFKVEQLIELIEAHEYEPLYLSMVFSNKIIAYVILLIPTSFLIPRPMLR